VALKGKDKVDIIRNQIRAYKSMQTVPELKKLKRPEKGAVSFLLSLLIELVGPEVIKQIIISFLTKNLIKGENSIKNSLKNLLVSDNSSKGSNIPNEIKNGFKIPLNKLDKCGAVLKTDPNTKEGKDMIIPGSMDDHLQKSINNTLNSFSFSNYKSVLETQYNNSDDTISLKSHTSQNNNSFSLFLVNYIDSMNIINSKPLIKTVIDFMFGNLTPLKYSIECLIEKLKTDKILEKIKDDVSEDDVVLFDFTNKELNDIEKEAEQLIKGNKKIDLGCGFMEMNFDIDEINNIIDGLENIGESSIQQVTNVVDNMENHVASNNLTTVQQKENQSTVKNGFARGFLEIIELYLIRQAILGPQMQMLFMLIDVFKGNLDIVGGELQDSSESLTQDLKNRKSLIKNLTKQTKSIITQAIFEKFTTECNKLKSSIIPKYAKDVFGIYGKQMAGLIGIRDQGVIG